MCHAVNWIKYSPVQSMSEHQAYIKSGEISFSMEEEVESLDPSENGYPY